MTIKAMPKALTLKPTKVNEQKLSTLRSKVKLLYDRGLKMRKELEGLIDQIEEIKPLLG